MRKVYMGIRRYFGVLLALLVLLSPLRALAGDESGPGQLGTQGMLRVYRADTPRKDSIGVRGSGMFYHRENLWNSKTHERMDAQAVFSQSPHDFAEIAFAAYGSAHSIYVPGKSEGDEQVKDFFLQTLGDFQLMGKGGYPINDWFSAGGQAWMKINTKPKDLGIMQNATSVGMRALASADWRDHPKEIPLVTHLNIGYFWDRSRNILGAFDQGDEEVVNASTIAALNLREGDQWLFGLGAEFPVDYPFRKFWTPFFEYTAEIAQTTRRREWAARSWNQNPQRFTFGVRWHSIDWLKLDGGLDLGLYNLGLGKKYRYAGGKEPPDVPWALHGAVIFFFQKYYDVGGADGYLRGRILDAQTQQPVADARIEFLDLPDDFSAQASDRLTGEFLSYPLESGEVVVRVYKDQYEPREMTINILERQTVNQDILLDKLIDSGDAGKFCAVIGRVMDEDDSSPLEALVGFSGKASDVRTDGSSGVFQKILRPGVYEVTVESAGYVGKRYKVPCQEGKKTVVTFNLTQEEEVGALAGTIRNAENKEVCRVGGAVSFDGGRRAPIAAGTDGSFFSVLPAGTYQIQVNCEGYLPRRFRIPIRKGKKTVVNFDLERGQAQGAIAGKVIDADTGQPLRAFITFDDESIQKVESNPADGSFEAKGMPPKNYVVTITAQGCGRKRYKVPVKFNQVTRYDFKIKCGRIEDLVTETECCLAPRDPIKFIAGTEKIDPSSYVYLDAMAAYLKENPTKRMSVEVHSKIEGAATDNLTLTKKRAEFVKRYLETQAIQGSRINPVGYGETRPIAPPSPPEKDALNERIEFILQ